MASLVATTNEGFTVVNLPELIINNLSKKTTFIIINKSLTIALLETLLLISCIINDNILFKSSKLVEFTSAKTGIDTHHVNAVLDNGVHATIAILAYLIFSLPNISILNLLLAGLISSFIDVDHFLSARSFYLADAITLQKRPFMHNTLTLLLVNTILFIYLHAFKSKLRYLAIIFFLSWFTHHVRDGIRRGLWFGGEYSTAPIRYDLYIAIICIIPLIARFFKDN